MTDRIGNWIAIASPGFLEPLWLRFLASPISVRLAKGVFWSLLGAVISRVMGVASSVLVARTLGIFEFGEFSMIQGTVGLFGTFAGLGLGITATKYVAELRDVDPERCGRIIGLLLLIATAGGILAGAALVLLADWFAAKTLAAPQLAPLLRAGSALVLFSTLQGVYSGALGGFEAFKRVAQTNWMGVLLGTPFLIVGTLVDGLCGAVWGTVLQTALGCVLGHLALSREAAMKRVHLSYEIARDDFSILWRFSLPAFLSTAIAGPANWLCNTFLANQNEGYKEVALLNAVGQWKNFVGFLPLMMTSVLVPMFANLYQSGNEAEFRKLMRRNLVLNVGVCLVLALPLSLCASFVMGWYGPGFGRGVPVFVLSLWGTAAVAANNLLSRAMQATGRAWIEFSFSVLWAFVLISACFLLIPGQKAVGVAISHIVAALLLAIWQWMLIRRLFGRGARV